MKKLILLALIASAAAQAGTGKFMYHRMSGEDKICFYRVVSGEVTISIAKNKTCPRTIKF